MDELELEELIRRAVDARPVPDRPLRRGPAARAGRSVLVGLGVGAIALLLIVLGSLVGGFRGTEVAASTPDPHLSTLPARVTQEEAIGTVRRLNVVGRVDRIDAKLMSFDEYSQVAGPVRTRPGDPGAKPIIGFGLQGDTAHRYIWVVAVSGEVWPSGRAPTQFGIPPAVPATPFPPYRWAMVLVDATSGAVIVVGDAGIAEPWPPAFAGLPAHGMGQ